MVIIDKKLLDEVSAQAKATPRLRKNYNFHPSVDDLCYRMLNALEPGTAIPIHHYSGKDETFVILRGKIRVTTYNDDGIVAERVILSQEDGRYGVNISKNVCHTLEALEPNSCIFESKQGSFVPHEKEGVLKITPKQQKHF
jgi:cupin fold WbuC family metalloprotein